MSKRIMIQKEDVQLDIFSKVRDYLSFENPTLTINEIQHAAPYLMKSSDEKLWVRVFFRRMEFYDFEAIEQEIKRLLLLIPDKGRLFLFTPECDEYYAEKLMRMHGGITFFEYSLANRSEGMKVKKFSRALHPTVKSAPGARSAQIIPSAMQLSQSELHGMLSLGLKIKAMTQVCPQAA